jgi:tetratricopeptide (TPR) repeat protein
VQARAASSLLPELSAVLSLHMSAEERALREQLAAKAVALKRKDYFQMLGVAPDAPVDAVKQAYFALAKEFHPDRHYRSASLEVKSLANEIYQLISTAYETLKDRDERERYVSDLARGIKKDVSDEVSKILAAEGKFQRGEELLRKKQYREAHAAFDEAVRLYDQEGEFHAFLGWTLFQTEPRNPKVAQAAMDHLETAIRLNPKVDKSYLFLGYVFKATGRPDKAQQQFERAIQCNPDCTEALRELRLLGSK